MFLLPIFMAWLAVADVCVRNYTGGANSPCQLSPGNFVNVRDHADICVRSYAVGYCALTPKEYRYVYSTDGTRICTVHYDQPQLVNLCDRYPQFYDYVPEAEFR